MGAHHPGGRRPARVLGRGGVQAALCAAVSMLAIGLAPTAAALAATTISVSSPDGTLGSAGGHRCTLRDALVLAGRRSNPALLTRAESRNRVTAGEVTPGARRTIPPLSAP